jgi:hypothetical protein
MNDKTPDSPRNLRVPQRSTGIEDRGSRQKVIELAERLRNKFDVLREPPPALGRRMDGGTSTRIRTLTYRMRLCQNADLTVWAVRSAEFG